MERAWALALVGVLAATVIAMIFAASAGNKALSAAAVTVASAALIGAGLSLKLNGKGSFAGNTRLAALVYAWGAAAMLGVYVLSGLYWQHGWEYGTAMALAAAGLLAYAGQAAEASKPSARLWFWLTLAHGSAAALGLIFILAAGKLSAGKPDWAANHIFLAGAAAIIAICALSLSNQRGRA